MRAAKPWASPFDLLPCKPCVHPVIFVHRVEGLEKGLYIWLRDAGQEEELKEAMLEDFVWERPSRTPQDIELYLLSRFEEPLQKYGPWYYSRLYWECGVIGQAFYLAGEAAGFQGCGIGCFFDDMVHRMLGLSGCKYQDLYHFTLGRAIADPRPINLHAYD